MEDKDQATYLELMELQMVAWITRNRSGNLCSFFSPEHSHKLQTVKMRVCHPSYSQSGGMNHFR